MYNSKFHLAFRVNLILVTWLVVSCFCLKTFASTVCAKSVVSLVTGENRLNLEPGCFGY